MHDHINEAIAQGEKPQRSNAKAVYHCWQHWQ